MSYDPLFDVARETTDKICGRAAYARLNLDNPGIPDELRAKLRAQVELEERGFAYQRDLDGGRSIWVQPRLYNATVIVGPTNEGWYDSHWCYETVEDAIAAAERWDPAQQREPEGWFRHAASGRRRPGGDKEKEYIEP